MSWVTGAVALVALSIDCFAVDITFGWKPSPDTNVVAYNVYYGVVSGDYTNVVTTGATNSVTIPDLVPGTTYFFAVTSYDTAGLEGLFSPETSYTVPIPNQPPTIDPIADVSIAENRGIYTVNLTGISSGAPSEIQALTITANSSNPTVVPNPVVDYTSPGSSGTLTLAPLANAFGSAMITVAVDDGQKDHDITTRSFIVTICQRVSPPFSKSTRPIQVSLCEDKPVRAINSVTLPTSGKGYGLVPERAGWHRN